VVYLHCLKNNLIRCYFQIHMFSVVNYHGPGLTELLRKYYEKNTEKLQLYYRSADYRSLQVTTITTITTGFVGTSHGLLMQEQPPDLTLLNRMSLGAQTPSLLDRMSSPDSLQRLPLRPEAIKKYSLIATPSSKDIERGRSQKRQYMPISSRSLPRPLVMTGEGLTQPSDPLSPRLRATTPRLELQTKRGLGGVSTLNSRQRSASPSLSVSDGHASDGEPASKKAKVDESVYAWVASRKDKRTVLRDSLAKPSNSLKPIQSTLKQPNGPLSMNQIALSSGFRMEEHHLWKSCQP